MFEEMGGGGGKKRKWVMIAIGTGIIAIFLVIRRSTAAANAAAQANAAAPAAPVITDTGAYPSDSFGGGISGTGMDQTLSTYLAIADQNTNVQMGAVADQLHTIQDQMNVNNKALQDQIIAINSKATAGNLNQAAQPPVTTTPASTSHPDPTSISHVITKGESLYSLAVQQYGSPHAAMAGGIRTIQAANPTIKDPNRIYAGNTIKIPTKLA